MEQDPRLLIDVDALAAEGWSFADEVAPAQVTALLNEHGSTDLRAVSPLRASLKAYALTAQEGVRLTGRGHVDLQAPCARCLAPAPVSVDVDVAMTLFPAGAPRRPARPAAAEEAPAAAPKRSRKRARPEPEPDEGRVGLLDDDLETGTYAQGEVDVAQILREQVLLEIPISLLCRPDCKGLCQTCGADLNATTCNCAPPQGDPRLAALSRIKLG